ncbi:MAG: DUF4956 domain-containing protein [Planctomycetes bacterium]|nr:DUF4956 domain-containing protein [Planctomycetota bacterium]
MLDWLRDEIPNDKNISLDILALRLGTALLLGSVIAGIYRLARGRPTNDAANLLPTLVLLTVLISLVTVVIGGSVARAFGLVGALSIVRFRTVVEDTRDTAFVIFAVAVGMGVGAGFWVKMLVALPVPAVAALAFRTPKPPPSRDEDVRLLTVRVGVGHNPDVLLRKPFETHLEHWDVVAAATARQGAAVDLTYGVRLRHPGAAVPFIMELNGLEGIQSAELRQK